jgi:pyruvate/2-oxoglutarate dehydrogenase complex dihydrolipoamide dehydrogenase (E3) component
MQAALKASQRGHQVILCEKSDRLGGALLCEERVPFKSGLSRYLKRQAARVMRSPIEVHLKTEVTPEVAKSFKPHVIIAALGSRPVIPNIKGLKGKNVVGAMEAYLRPEVVGKKVAIIGGGLVGLELGLFLAREGRNVTVTEMLDTTIASPPPVEGVSNRMGGFTWMTLGHPLYHGIAIRLEAEQLSNLKICVSTKGVQVSDKGLVVEDANGLRTIEADTVIYAVGQQPLREEAQALAACAPEFHQIGDCVAPKTVFEATSVAYQIATDIGRF